MSKCMTYKIPSEALGATSNNQNSKSFEKGSIELPYLGSYPLKLIAH